MVFLVFLLKLYVFGEGIWSTLRRWMDFLGLPSQTLMKDQKLSSARLTCRNECSSHAINYQAELLIIQCLAIDIWQVTKLVKPFCLNFHD